MIHVNHMTNLSFARRYRSKACKQRSIRLFTNQNIAILLLKVHVRNVLSSNTIHVPCCRIVRETYLMTHVMFAQWHGWEAWDSRCFTTHHVTVCVNTLFGFSMLFRWNNTNKQAKCKNCLTAELASTWCFVLIHTYLVTLQVLQLFEFDIGTKTWMADDFN